MASQLPVNGRLDGWKAISDYLGWHTRTVMRWEQQKALPVHRIPGGQRHAVFAFRSEIDEWLKSGRLDDNGADEANGLQVYNSDHSQSASEVTLLEPLKNATFPRTAASRMRSWPSTNRRRVVLISAAVVLLAVGAYAIHSLAYPRRIHFTGVVQLTNDGASKEGLVTDGRILYFGEYRGSRMVLASVSAEGGPVRQISTPFVRVVPASISPDGKNLLVLVREGVEVERTLWVLPLAGGQPRRIGEIRCHSAAWSPDGRSIAFAAQSAINVTTDEGASIRQLQVFDAVPDALHWSIDGKRLRFDLVDPKSLTSTIWELVLNDQDGTQMSSLIPLHIVLRNGPGGSTTLDEQGRSFVWGGDTGDERILLLERVHGFWNSPIRLVAMNSSVQQTADLALDSNSERVFAIAQSTVPRRGVETGGSDLLWFDRNSREFQPFLPGISATFVDFSKDGRRIVYLRLPNSELWISNKDGSAARRVEVQANQIELPRWSPDGKWIAFMAREPDKPWRIFVVSADGGKPREVSVGTDQQGAPTWSPDGKWLVYGNVQCQEKRTCAIHKIDLSTGQELAVPDSEGLGTARWSPNGRFLAALHPEKHEVQVFDLVAQRWRKLADGINGNDLSWSKDSRYIYAARPAGNQPEILRISLKDGKTETAVDLWTFTQLKGRIDQWFALAPDGSIIFSREMGANEIYSLPYEE